ncbi:Polyketide transferase [Lachnellula subtilissima]|uniref:Polyketide transferase n=1 Tax=Lachnellula subtilissima TaxID=602034 RepID=A0A8H8UBJ3_9HELO|nr:Polyketide transferase [Lachnellula subtilissima]
MTDKDLPRLDVEFPTLDGLTLRAWLFPASKRGPGMIMTPGFNMPKDAQLPDLAKWFQERDITCLLYDPRGIGASDGQPRNDIDARQMAEDLHDAVTWLLKEPLVDETKIALWGLCFGGNVTLAAAAFDKRIAAMITIGPVIDSSGNPDRRQPILELVMHDRAMRLEGEEPMYLPYINEDGGIANGLEMPADMMPALERLGVPVENRISVQTYHKGMSWNILSLVEYISPTPVLMVTPEFDKSCPTADQLKCYALLKEPKELDILKGKGHIDWLFGDIESVLNRQLDFLKRRIVF